MSTEKERREEQEEREMIAWLIKETRKDIDDGLESGLHEHKETAYVYTKLAYKDFQKHLGIYYRMNGLAKAASREKGLHRFFLGMATSSEHGEEDRRYGKNIRVLDIGKLLHNCMLFYMPIENGGIIIVRIIIAGDF
ncbi:type II toxin-antitoxin system RelE/ParE family toxin [Aquimarina macrocephali]|uniref:type II toxin-antitoxin system RelE/ParE family toxin n=1 Tax=Aquimarina macrocephali TaxID=666563 RepID=UPI0004666876|nr:type II toxin-antitoxin system RelE/ParE family toxin [Aquimarina macrocephali]